MDISVSMAIVAFPLLLFFVLKSHAGIMFFAACSGLVLLNSLDPAVVYTAGAVVPIEGEAYVRMGVVLLAIGFGGLLFRNAISGLLLPLHVVLSLLLGAMLWLLLPGVTGVTWLVDGTQSSLWVDSYNYRTIIIAAAFGLSLFTLLFKKTDKSHKKSEH